MDQPLPHHLRVAGKCLAWTMILLAPVWGLGCAENAGSRAEADAPLSSADALYRQGQAVEDRKAPSDAQARANLQEARTLYIQALRAHPSPALEGYIRAGIGNVSFYQEDYQTAVDQFAAAFDRIDDPMLKSMILYRKGMAQQRLSLFPQADQTFAQLQKLYPQSEAARLSAAKAGARGFYVQLGIFTQPPLADKAVAQLRKEGYAPGKLADSQGRQVVRVGPFRTYGEARVAQGRLLGPYPKSLIVP